MRRSKTFVVIVIVSIALYCGILLWRGVREAAPFRHQDRINILLYGVEPIIISLGLTDHVNYLMRFDNSIKTYAPGGYGIYGIGGLGKLSSLEHDPDLLRRTFSLMTSTDIDYYLLPKDSKVYQDSDFTKGFSPTKSAILSAMFSSKIISNIRFLDKMYLVSVIGRQRKIDYIALKTGFIDNINKTSEFASDEFFKEYQGFFYNKSLRDIDTTIQIQYSSSFLSAKHIGRVLDGEGIRVADIDIAQKPVSKCLIRYKNSNDRLIHLVTEDAVRKLLQLHCVTEYGLVNGRAPSDSFDMVIVLSPQLEELWH